MLYGIVQFLSEALVKVNGIYCPLVALKNFDNPQCYKGP